MISNSDKELLEEIRAWGNDKWPRKFSADIHFSDLMPYIVIKVQPLGPVTLNLQHHGPSMSGSACEKFQMIPKMKVLFNNDNQYPAILK